MYIYIHTCVYTNVYIYIYIYIYMGSSCTCILLHMVAFVVFSNGDLTCRFRTSRWQYNLLLFVACIPLSVIGSNICSEVLS